MKVFFMNTVIGIFYEYYCFWNVIRILSFSSNHCFEESSFRILMIFFVWSLVLSAVQFARRQRLVSILSEYFVWNLSHNSVLLCRKIPYFSCFSKNKKGWVSFSLFCKYYKVKFTSYLILYLSISLNAYFYRYWFI